MKLKNAELFALLMFCTSFFCSVEAYGIGNYQTGDTLYIWANNGLILRASPDPKGARITTIPYGESVVVIRKDPKLSHLVKEYGGFILYGQWAEVWYQGKFSGYVFDGYLSSYPARTNLDDRDGFEGFLAYFATVFGSAKRTGHGYQPNSSQCLWEREIYQYKNGSIAVQACGEGGYINTYELPNFSFEEAYLLFFLQPRAYWLKRSKNAWLDIPLYVWEQNRKAIRMEYEMTTFVFEKKKGSILMKIWASC